jgi:hypothetical protein
MPLPDSILRIQRPEMRRTDYLSGDSMRLAFLFYQDDGVTPRNLTGFTLSGEVLALLPASTTLAAFTVSASVLADGLAIFDLTASVATAAIVAPAGTPAAAVEALAARFICRISDGTNAKSFAAGPVYVIRQVVQ